MTPQTHAVRIVPWQWRRNEGSSRLLDSTGATEFHNRGLPPAGEEFDFCRKSSVILRISISWFQHGQHTWGKCMVFNNQGGVTVDFCRTSLVILRISVSWFQNDKKTLRLRLSQFHAHKRILKYGYVEYLACMWKFGLHHDVHRIDMYWKNNLSQIGH